MSRTDKVAWEEELEWLFLGISDSEQLDGVSDFITETSKAWLLEVKVNKFMVKFKVDTGAAVTTISWNLKKSMGNAIRSNKNLWGADNHELEVTGQAEVTLSAGAKQIVDTVYFVDHLALPLLSKPAISKLVLI